MGVAGDADGVRGGATLAPVPQGIRVVILGAGIAGMTAANLPPASGYQVES